MHSVPDFKDFPLAYLPRPVRRRLWHMLHQTQRRLQTIADNDAARKASAAAKPRKFAASSGKARLFLFTRRELRNLRTATGFQKPAKIHAWYEKSGFFGIAFGHLTKSQKSEA